MRTLKVFPLLLLAAIISACSSVPTQEVGLQPDPISEQIVRDRVQILRTQANGDAVETKSTSKNVDEATKQKLRSAKKVIHTFSDNSVIGYMKNGYGDFMEFAGHIIIAREEQIVDYIVKIEEGIEEKRKAKVNGVSTQGVGLKRDGCSGWFLWWCTNPTSNYIWPNKITYYKIAPGAFNSAQQNAIIAAITAWNNTYTNIKWYSTSTFGATVNGIYYSELATVPWVKIVPDTSGYCGTSYVQ